MTAPAAPAWRHHAATLAGQLTSTAPAWHDAVAATPRHLLVPRWWEEVAPGPVFGVVVPDEPRLLDAAYSDTTLITRLGPHHADLTDPARRVTGPPTSSATLPGLIVDLLDHLDVHDSHRVLDVGTGSGYSAALLAHRLGDDQVTSIDVDDYLVQAARDRLASFDRHPHLHTVDATGPLPGGDYDRILATVSVRPVPATWLAALRPGGRLLTTIAHTPLLVTATARGDGTATGHVIDRTARFMTTRHDTTYPPRLDDLWQQARDTDGDTIADTTTPLPDLFTDWPLATLIELTQPGIEHRSATIDGHPVLWLLHHDGSWARVEDTGTTRRAHQTGPRNLWNLVEHVIQRRDDQPFPLHQLTVDITPDTTTLTAPTGWRFAL